MNWITKIIKAGEKIKTAIHKRASKEDIANSDWTSCCKGPILKKSLEQNLWVCPDTSASAARRRSSSRPSSAWRRLASTRRRTTRS